MTMAEGNAARSGRTPSTHLDYTPDRYTAMHLVNRNEISSVGAVLRRRDGGDLEPGVFASLLTLQHVGYVERDEPPAGDRTHPRQWPVRLTLRGMQLLSRFSLERAQHVARTELGEQVR